MWDDCVNSNDDVVVNCVSYKVSLSGWILEEIAVTEDWWGRSR